MNSKFVAMINKQQVLDTVFAFTKAKGYPPTAKEVFGYVQAESFSTVYRFLNELQAEGYIRFEGSHPKRAIILKYEQLNKDVF